MRMLTCRSKTELLFLSKTGLGVWAGSDTLDSFAAQTPSELTMTRDSESQVMPRHATPSSLCAQTTDTETALEIDFVSSWPPSVKVVWTSDEKTKATHKDFPLWAHTYSVTAKQFMQIRCKTSDPL
jgi:hypothetical protein